MKNEIELLIEKSLRAIKSAKREYDASDFDYACSRSYYSVSFFFNFSKSF
jgi:uncharacterized protein (UPF0332 family)